MRVKKIEFGFVKGRGICGSEAEKPWEINVHCRACVSCALLHGAVLWSVALRSVVLYRVVCYRYYVLKVCRPCVVDVLGSIKAGCVPCSGCCVLLCALGLCCKLSVVAKCVRVAGVVKWIARDRWVRCHGSGKCHWK